MDRRRLVGAAGHSGGVRAMAPLKTECESFCFEGGVQGLWQDLERVRGDPVVCRDFPCVPVTPPLAFPRLGLGSCPPNACLTRGGRRKESRTGADGPRAPSGWGSSWPAGSPYALHLKISTTYLRMPRIPRRRRACARHEADPTATGVRALPLNHCRVQDRAGVGSSA